MELWFGIYVSILVAANVTFMVYIYLERHTTFKKEGERAAEKILEKHFEAIQLEEKVILEDYRNSIKAVIANTELSAQQGLGQLNEYILKAHTQQVSRINEFSAKLYGILVDSGKHFSDQMNQYITDANKRIDEWQESYIQIMKREIDLLIETERKKVEEFTESEKKRIQMYVKEQASKETSMIVEEVLTNNISIRDQERMIQQAVDKFFKEV